MGTLDISTSGLPSTAAAQVVVTGPSGYSRTLTASMTLSALVPGTYSIVASAVTASGNTYAPSPSSQTIAVGAGPGAAANVTYAISTGAIAISVGGLPAGAQPAVTISGPGGYHTVVSASASITGLTPGAYTVSAAPVLNEGDGYGVPAPVTATVAASLTPTIVDVSYALVTGKLAVSVSGLPAGTDAPVQISGPAGYSTTISQGTTLTGLAPGSYSVSASAVTTGLATYAPVPAAQTVGVSASATPAQASVAYSVTSGALQVSVNGLPPLLPASITVSGPGGFAAVVTATQTLSGLAPGTYAVAAQTIVNGGTVYTPAPLSQDVAVASGTTAGAAVVYTGSSIGPNLFIDGMYVTQAVQTYAGGVPLVAGRDGLLRVFVRAGAPNATPPEVRVRAYVGAALVSTFTIPAPGPVPTAVTEGVLSSSWNVVLPGALVQPNLRLLADVDPANAIAEGDESDNAYPVSGSPLPLDVRSVSTLNLRLVPVTQSVNGLTGNVTPGNQSQYLASMRKVYPVAAIDADVRAAYTTNAPVLQANDGNNAWNTILSEISALRTADGSSRYYYGVVKTTYGSGVAGLGYVPGRAAIGWDHLPSGAGVAAHELGHNFGRWHAPCGGAGQVDPAYPYAGGTIGVYGYDAATATLKAPGSADLMGYCSNTWISDYNYVAVLDFRAANPAVVTSGASQRSLLIWGRVSRGQLIIEPVYEIDAPPSLPARRGSHTLDAFDEAGARLFSLSFDGEPIADAPDANDQTFAFAVPVDMLRGRALSRLRFTALGRQVEVRATGRAADRILTARGGEPVASRLPGGAVRVAWTDPAVLGALIRDARTGDILSFARGSGATVRTASAELDVIFSDGVRSERRRLTPR
jgi:hypothetical protein